MRIASRSARPSAPAAPGRTLPPDIDADVDAGIGAGRATALAGTTAAVEGSERLLWPKEEATAALTEAACGWALTLAAVPGRAVAAASSSGRGCPSKPRLPPPRSRGCSHGQRRRPLQRRRRVAKACAAAYVFTRPTRAATDRHHWRHGSCSGGGRAARSTGHHPGGCSPRHFGLGRIGPVGGRRSVAMVCVRPALASDNGRRLRMRRRRDGYAGIAKNGAEDAAIRLYAALRNPLVEPVRNGASTCLATPPSSAGQAWRPCSESKLSPSTAARRQRHQVPHALAVRNFPLCVPPSGFLRTFPASRGSARSSVDRRRCRVSRTTLRP